MKKTKLNTMVYDNVRRDIVSGVYPPNTFLSEGQIAEKYGVSKAPVRTALHNLCEDGYLISYARKGYLITNTSTSDFAKIQQVRYALESLSVSFLIRYASAEDICTLREIAALDTPTDSSYTTVNAQFHMAMARMTDNRYLVQSLEALFADLSHLYPYLNTKNFPLEEQSRHPQLLDAIEAKDTPLALSLLRTDIEENTIENRYSIIS